MAFRKRNIVLSSSSSRSNAAPSQVSETDLTSEPSTPAVPSPTLAAPAIQPLIPGVRPSPIDGRPTTSTGTPSLDGILAGHAGLPLGTSLLVEEEGTTDYGGALVRFYAAEGVVQGHRVHVVGVGEGWGRGLPGLSEKDGKKRVKAEGAGAKKETGVGADAAAERMKIAWRYEGLGEFGSSKERGPRGAGQGQEDDSIFCHTFDLAKRLSLPVGGSAINYIPIRTPISSSSSNSGSTWTPPSPFASVLQNLQRELSTSPPHTIHRLILPSLLSPALYPPSSSAPTSILQFLHALRALLRIYPTRLTAIFTLPLSLYPRTTGLVRIMELLSDGVVTLSPFPHSTAQLLSTSAAATNEDEKPQGLFTIHKLPVYHEKGGGAGAEGLGEDLAFVLSRRRFKIVSFSLPPVEGDREAQEEAQRGQSGMPRKEELEF